MSRTTYTLLAISATICLLFTPTISHAQYRASIQGVVTDQQGAVVPGANCSLRNLETGQTTVAVTDDKGIFNFNGLPPAKFTLTVEKAGFKKTAIEGLGIVAEQANAINVQLDVGQAAESVTVVGDAVPLLNTESADISGTVKAREFQQFAAFGRDAFQLLQLAPGAFGDGAQSAGGGTNNLPANAGPGGTGGTDGVFKIENKGQITANGARSGENNYQIDGVGTTSVTWGGTSVITPNIDSIKEVKVVTDNYDAENGRYRGAQVQIISQNGTNSYHGSFFFKAHRPGLNAFTKYHGYNSDTPGCINDKAHGYCGNVRDESRFNDWGGSVGGPILKNRLFGFFSYETIDNNGQSTPGSGWYETPDFRALAASNSNASSFFSFPGVGPYGGTQVDHDCAFAGLIEGVNCHFIAGQGLNLGSPLNPALFPLGTRDPAYTSSTNPGTGGDGTGGANNLGNTADIAFFQGIKNPSTDTHRQYNGRVDFQATSRDLVAFSVYWVPTTSTSINGNGVRLMNHFNSTSLNRAATILYDHTFNATMANEVRVNAAGWQNRDLAQNPDGPWGLPQVSFNSVGSLVAGTSQQIQGYGIGSFNGFNQWTFAGKDVLTKIHGAHTMKMGGEVTHLKSVDAPFWADRPGYTFNNIWDFLNDAPVSENGQFDPTNGVPSAEIKNLRNILVGLFFQDNYKLRPNLTVTAGLRWDYFGPISERDGKLATVAFGSGANQLSGLRVRTGGSQYNAQKSNFGPQLGFAWSPGKLAGHDFANHLVIRGGFGIAYNGISQSNTLDVRFNPPYVNNGTSLSGNQILYINSFPADVHSPYGYASNPYAKTSFDSNNLPLTGQIDLTALPATWPTEYALHYSLGAEYDLGHQWVASAGYQGSRTNNLLQHYNLYNPAAAMGLALNPKVHGVTLYNDNGSAHFNALLLEAKHIFSQSFQLDTQYRLSHAVDPGSNEYAGPYYQWNLATGQGTADYDVRHAFKVFGVWSPKIFTGTRSWMEKILGGWSLSGILNAHSGFPWTPVYGLGEVLPQCTVAGVNGGLPGPCEPVFNYGPSAGGGSADAGSNNLQPAAYAGGFKANYRSAANVDATSMFTPPTVVAGTYFACLFPNPDPTACPSGQQGYGSLPTAPGMKRNAFTGPGYFGVDATLSKAFGLPSNKILGEHAQFEFRANFFNLFNKLNLYNPQNDIMNSHLGEAQNVLGSRVIEMQARFSF
jgi:carboxypeptidase family protein